MNNEKFYAGVVFEYFNVEEYLKLSKDLNTYLSQEYNQKFMMDFYPTINLVSRSITLFLNQFNAEEIGTLETLVEKFSLNNVPFNQANNIYLKYNQVKDVEKVSRKVVAENIACGANFDSRKKGLIFISDYKLKK
jgi:hypothetical protein